eukprot:6631458-Pyramimonas_sp.AAC.1
MLMNHGRLLQEVLPARVRHVLPAGRFGVLMRHLLVEPLDEVDAIRVAAEVGQERGVAVEGQQALHCGVQAADAATVDVQHAGVSIEQLLGQTRPLLLRVTICRNQRIQLVWPR